MDRRVLITGATGALGASVVRRFLAAGDRILAVGGRESTLAEIAGLGTGDQVAVEAADLTVASDVERVFAVWNDAGPTPTVVHLVGGFRFGRLDSAEEADWSFLVRINLEVTWRIARASARCFAAQRAGCLVAVSSLAALAGDAGVGAYAATKAGALRLIESLAHEIGSFGGRANSVLPGTMDTPANRAAMPNAQRAHWVSTMEVAEVIHFLASPAAAGVNGTAVRVDGRAL